MRAGQKTTAQELGASIADPLSELPDTVFWLLGTFRASPGRNCCAVLPLGPILLGRLKPLEGAVLLLGQPLDRLSRRDLSQAIALVAQEEDVSFEYAVLEYVVLGRAPYLGWLDAPKPAD